MDYQFTSFWGFVMAGAIIVFGAGFLVWRPFYARSILQHWAIKKRFEILQFKRCFICGGFNLWTTSYKQIVFYVKVRDDSGRERTCWVKFGRFFWVEKILPASQKLFGMSIRRMWLNNFELQIFFTRFPKTAGAKLFDSKSA